MNENDFDNSSSFEIGQREGNNEGLVKLVVAVFIMLGVLFWAFNDIEIPTDRVLVEEEYFEENTDELLVEEQVEEVIPDVETVDQVEMEQTLEFYYKRAQQREEGKDYEGAVEDYEKTILMAKKYSSEKWNSLNNVGIIKAQQFKDYKGALKHFNKIISIETNRYDGEINATRLEAGYTNRAFVKKKQGNIDGACDDLYEALGLGVEGSVAFIENQIDKNCL